MTNSAERPVSRAPLRCYKPEDSWVVEFFPLDFWGAPQNAAFSQGAGPILRRRSLSRTAGNQEKKY
jgi:hypothetical protein